MEKPKPLYNENGQVNEPDIAKEMAMYEERLRNDDKAVEKRANMEGVSKEKFIESFVEEGGKIAHDCKENIYNKEKQLELAEKLMGILSEDEKK